MSAEKRTRTYRRSDRRKSPGSLMELQSLREGQGPEDVQQAARVYEGGFKLKLLLPASI